MNQSCKLSTSNYHSGIEILIERYGKSHFTERTINLMFYKVKDLTELEWNSIVNSILEVKRQAPTVKELGEIVKAYIASSAQPIRGDFRPGFTEKQWEQYQAEQSKLRDIEAICEKNGITKEHLDKFTKLWCIEVGGGGLLKFCADGGFGYKIFYKPALFCLAQAEFNSKRSFEIGKNKHKALHLK